MAEIPFLTIRDSLGNGTSVERQLHTRNNMLYQPVHMWLAFYLGLCVEWKVRYQENNPLCLLSGIYGQMVISDVF